MPPAPHGPPPRASGPSPPTEADRPGVRHRPGARHRPESDWAEFCMTCVRNSAQCPRRGRPSARGGGGPVPAAEPGDGAALPCVEQHHDPVAAGAALGIETLELGHRAPRAKHAHDLERLGQPVVSRRELHELDLRAPVRIAGHGRQYRLTLRPPVRLAPSMARLAHHGSGPGAVDRPAPSRAPGPARSLGAQTRRRSSCDPTAQARTTERRPLEAEPPRGGRSR